jgi:hypothetical protein
LEHRGQYPLERTHQFNHQALVLLILVAPFQMANSWLTLLRLQMLPFQLGLEEMPHPLRQRPPRAPAQLKLNHPKLAHPLLLLQILHHLRRRLPARPRTAEQPNSRTPSLQL